MFLILPMAEFLSSEELTVLQRLAAEWRKAHSNDPSLSQSGYVTIFDGEVTGWKKELSHPETEQPGAYAVGVFNDVFLASGYDAFNGADDWKEVLASAEKRGRRGR